MFTLKEAALAHALAAEKLLGVDATFLNENEATIPVFVNLLFQSLEMTLKSFAIEAGLATEKELRDKKTTRNGHGIKEIAELINNKIKGKQLIDILLPRQGCAISNDIVKAMTFDERFSATRESYIKRNIAYSQFAEGDLQIVHGFKQWVDAVKKAAINIMSAANEIKWLTTK